MLAIENCKKEDAKLDVSPFSLRTKTTCWILTLMWFLLNIEEGLFPAALAQIRGYFDISFTMGGAIGSAYFFGICTSTPIAGYVSNFMPPVRIILGGMLLWLISVMVLGITENWILLLVCRFTQGVGKSMLETTAPVIVDAISAPGTRSLRISLFYATHPLGFAIGHIIGGILVDHTWFSLPLDESWRCIYIFHVVIGVTNVLICL